MKTKPSPPNFAAAVRSYLDTERTSLSELLRQIEPHLIGMGITAQGLSSRLSAQLSEDADGSRLRSQLAIMAAFFRVSGVDPREFFGV